VLRYFVTSIQLCESVFQGIAKTEGHDPFFTVQYCLARIVGLNRGEFWRIPESGFPEFCLLLERFILSISNAQLSLLVCSIELWVWQTGNDNLRAAPSAT
jgi:hypothetical protein